MIYPLSERAPSASDLTAKNRVWGFFENSNRTRPANRRKPQQPRRKNRLTPTKTASGIPYWPSRDPIGERGGVNLYGFVGNDGVGKIDILGREETAVAAGGAAVVVGGTPWLSSALLTPAAALVGVAGIVVLTPMTIDAIGEAGKSTAAENSIREQGVELQRTLDARRREIERTREALKKKHNSSPSKDPSPNPKPTGPIVPPISGDPDCDEPNGCKPCKPPVGSQYHWIQLPYSRQRGRHAYPPYNDGHVKIWTVHQSPYPACECYINETVQDHTQVGPPGSIEVFAKPPKPTGGGPIFLP